MEASPVSVLSKACPLKIPAIRRVVVPLLPASRIWEGADRPRSPFPWIRISSGFSSIWIPRRRKHSMVERQSAPRRKFRTAVVPSAREPNMTARWEMDLSPGTESSPRMLFTLANFMEILLFPCGFIVHKWCSGISAAGRRPSGRPLRRKTPPAGRPLQIPGCG